MKLKKGDLIVIENTDCLQKPINQFYKKWETATVMAMAMATAVSTATATVTAMATAMATEKQTGKKVKLKYYATGWKRFENNRLVGIVTEITKEDHRDFDLIRIREQTGGVRYCRRYILENV